MYQQLTKLLLAAVFFLPSVLLFSQSQPQAGTSRSDSLQMALEEHPERDSVRMELNLSLFSELIYKDVITASGYAREALTIAREIEDLRGQARAHNQLGTVFQLRHSTPGMMTHFSEALKFYQELGDRKWEANMMANLGIVYRMDGDWQKSLDYEKEALAIREELGDMENTGGILHNIGLAYYDKGDTLKALEYFKKAYDGAISDGNKQWAAVFLGSLANVAGDQGNYPIAEKYMDEAYAIHEEFGNKVDMARDIFNKGLLYKMQGDCPKAMGFFRESYRFSSQMNLNLLLERLTSAMSTCEEEMGNTKRALELARENRALSDSLKSGEISASLKAAELSFEIEKMEKDYLHEIEMAEVSRKAANKRQDIVVWAGGISGLLLLIVVILLLRRNAERKALNQRLEERVRERTEALSDSNSQLAREVEQRRQTQSDLNTFIYRSSHDLKSPLTSIKGLVSLAEGEVAESEYLPLIKGRVERMDTELERLLETVRINEKQPESVPVDVNELWGNIHSRLEDYPGASGVRFKLVDETSTAPNSDPFALETILWNLIRNTVDFGREGGSGQTLVTFSGGGNKWKMEVKDNGEGVAPEIQEKIFEMFYRGNNRSRGTGMGLYIVRRACERIGASLSLTSPESGGSCFVVEK